MVSSVLLNGVRSGNRFEKRISTGKWKRPHVTIKHRVGFVDHIISSLGPRTKRLYCDSEHSPLHMRQTYWRLYTYDAYGRSVFVTDWNCLLWLYISCKKKKKKTILIAVTATAVYVDRIGLSAVNHKYYCLCLIAIRGVFRCSLGYGVGMPVLPVRNNLRRPTSSHHFSSASRFQFQKGFASRCSWKCTSIVLIIVCLLMAVALTFTASKFSKYTTTD